MNYVTLAEHLTHLIVSLVCSLYISAVASEPVWSLLSRNK